MLIPPPSPPQHESRSPTMRLPTNMHMIHRRHFNIPKAWEFGCARHAFRCKGNTPSQDAVDKPILVDHQSFQLFHFSTAFALRHVVEEHARESEVRRGTQTQQPPCVAHVCTCVRACVALRCVHELCMCVRLSCMCSAAGPSMLPWLSTSGSGSSVACRCYWGMSQRRHKGSSKGLLGSFRPAC